MIFLPKRRLVLLWATVATGGYFVESSKLSSVAALLLTPLRELNIPLNCFFPFSIC